jgi:hypothetical protein
MIPSHIQQRFHQRYEWCMTDCWNWTASKTKGGYGNIGWMFDKTRYNVLSHRLSYELYNSPIPNDMVVRHMCDNPSCVNPNHLILGTQQDNTRDMFARNRDNKAVGEKQAQSVLTESQVSEIRDKYIPGKYSMTKLAEEYGVWHSTIRLIVRNITWTHLL